MTEPPNHAGGNPADPARSPAPAPGGAGESTAFSLALAWRKRPAVRAAFYLLALALLAAAVWFALAETSGQEGGPGGFARLAHADPLDAAVIALLIVASIALNGVVFWLIAKPFEHARTEPAPSVTLPEMTALIGASSLLNYLPMRAGMVGRAAYLKRRHHIPLTASVVMLLMVGGGTVYIYLVMSIVTLWRGSLDPAWWATVVALLAAGSLAAVPVARIKVRLTPMLDAPWFASAGAPLWLGAAALVFLRAADVLLAAGRLYLAARILGQPIDLAPAIVMASGGMFIKQATPLPNGFGVVELFYALCASLGIAADSPIEPQLATAVGLVDRAVEVIVFVVVGLGSLLFLRDKWHGDDPELTDPTRAV